MQAPLCHIHPIFMMSRRVSVRVCPFFTPPSLCTEGSATLVYKHIVNLSPACTYTHVHAGQWTHCSSLGPDIKAMSASVWWDLTDDTSSPSFPFWSLLTRSSIRYIMQPPLSVPAHNFFFLIISMSTCFSATFLTTFLLFILHSNLCVPSFLDIRAHTALAVPLGLQCLTYSLCVAELKGCILIRTSASTEV